MDERQRILIIDDNVAVIRVLENILEEEGFDVWPSLTAEDGLELIQKKGLPHLAIVDLDLPGMDGFAFCRKVLTFSDLPIIMLSADGAEKTVVEGLDRFAEDYIVKTKPNAFRKGELVSRVNRVMRRIGDFAYTLSPLIHVNDNLQISFSERRMVRNGKELTLTPTESKMLYILMRHAGRTVSSEYLIRRIWPLEMAFEDRLHTHIHRLRKKIEDNPREPEYIVADWGNGYIFPRFDN